MLRVALSSRLTLPRVLELASALRRGRGGPVTSVSGKAMEGTMLEGPRALLVLGSLGLTSLNVVWLAKILLGVCKIFARGRSGGAASAAKLVQAEEAGGGEKAGEEAGGSRTGGAEAGGDKKGGPGEEPVPGKEAKGVGA
jgi:hypothetical protein